MSRERRIIAAFYAPLLGFLLGAILHAQEFRSTISGSVTDPQGAAIAGVKLSGVQAETGARTETATTGEGLYTLPFLVPGTYTLFIQAPGFKGYERKGITVNANERVRVDILLEVGAVSEAVTVTADASLLETATGSSGQSINQRQIESMPLNGRTPMVAAALAPGVVFTLATNFVHAYDNGGNSAFVMGGGAVQQNSLMVDGGENTRASNGQMAYAPPVDAVQEVKVETFTVDAAYGRTGGGTINVVLRSGTNQLHGAAFYYGQTSALNANEWLLNSRGQPKPVSQHHQYGFSGGGPVYLPKLVNGKDKLFWMFAFEGIKHAGPDPWSLTVPAPAQRTGDFSALLAAGGQYQIYDPATGVRSGATVLRQPFAANMIPSSRLSPIAQKVLSFIPLPKDGGLATGQNNFVAQTRTTNTFDSEIGRLDYNVSDRHKIFWSARHNLRIEDRFNWWLNEASGRYNERYNLGSTLDDVYTFTPTTVLDVRFNYTRYIDRLSYGSSSFEPSQLGFPAYLTAASVHPGFPAFNLGAFSPAGPTSNAVSATTAGNNNPEESLHLFGTLTTIVSAHSIKFGVDARQYRLNPANFGHANGLYNFENSRWTNGPLGTAASSPIGQDLASFLLGLPSSGQFDVNANGAYRQNYFALFVQNDWRVRRNLTLNLGLRAEHDFGPTERYNRNVAGFDFDAANPVQPAAQIAYARNPIPEVTPGSFRTPGGLLFAGPQGRGITRPRSTMFSPRFGFAWTPDSSAARTVIRGGFGIFVFPVSLPNSLVVQSGFSQAHPIVASNDGYLTPYATLSNPFPAGLPPLTPVGLHTFTGSAVSFYNPAPVSPYSLRWNVNVQRQLAKDLLVEAGYQGNRGVRLPVDVQQNYLPIQYMSSSPVRDQAAVTLLEGSVANPFAGLLPGSSLNGSTVQRRQLMMPFPQYTGVTQFGVNQGRSGFEMVFVRMEKRFGSGLQFLSSFQHSKLQMTTLRLNPQTPLVKEIAPDDRTDRFVFSATYDLPFGRGRRYGGSLPGIWDAIVGGWTMSGLTIYQSGAPVSWGNVVYLGGGLQFDSHNRARTFDTSRFLRDVASQPVNGVNLRTFANRFSNMRQDPIQDVQLSVAKQFTLYENLKLQLRGEAFNLLNHPMFGAPNVNPAAANFGTITSGQANLYRAMQLAGRFVW